MLRSFEQIRHPADPGRLVAADDEFATLTGSGAYAMPWHWHDCLMFILPSHGTVELKHEDRRDGSWLSQDRFAVVPPDRAHETQASVGPHRHLALYATAGTLRRLDHQVGSLSEFRRRIRTTLIVRRTPTIRSLQELSVRDGDGTYGRSSLRLALSSALLVQCIAEVMTGEALPAATHRGHGAALVEDLKEFVTQHADQDIPLDALGDRFGVSRRHITRLFRERTGQSIGAFQQQARLQAARDLLRDTDLPVGEVAFRVGFDSGAALARSMRRLDGRSPSDIRMARSVKP